MAANRLLAAPYPVPFQPSPRSPPSPSIAFRHPRYPPRLNRLFSLPRVDFTGNPDRPKGVHHRTALLACQIVANNAFDGHLYVDKEGQQPVQTALDGILEDDAYYFIINQDHRLRYAIVPTFDDWVFPHGQVPTSWPAPALNPDPHTDDTDRCVLTNHGSGLKRAHIVPGAEASWFEREGMGRYTDALKINSRMNLMLLRADIHKTYDWRAFVIVPKKEIFDPDEPQPPTSTYVVHFLEEPVGEFWNMYHNVPVQHINKTYREFHLARFAWAIMSRVKDFLLQGHTREVVRVEDGVQKTMLLEGPALKKLYGGGERLGARPLKPRTGEGIEDPYVEGKEGQYSFETEDDDELATELAMEEGGRLHGMEAVTGWALGVVA